MEQASEGKQKNASMAPKPMGIPPKSVKQPPPPMGKPPQILRKTPVNAQSRLAAMTKLPVLPGVGLTLTRLRLGEKLFQPTTDLNLSDPNCHIMRPSYNSLHDPNVKEYHRQKDTHDKLKKQNLIVEDDKIKSMNEQKQAIQQRKMQEMVKGMHEYKSMTEASNGKRLREQIFKTPHLAPVHQPAPPPPPSKTVNKIVSLAGMTPMDEHCLLQRRRTLERLAPLPSKARLKVEKANKTEQSPTSRGSEVPSQDGAVVPTADSHTETHVSVVSADITACGGSRNPKTNDPKDSRSDQVVQSKVTQGKKMSKTEKSSNGSYSSYAILMKIRKSGVLNKPMSQSQLKSVVGHAILDHLGTKCVRKQLAESIKTSAQGSKPAAQQACSARIASDLLKCVSRVVNPFKPSDEPVCRILGGSKDCLKPSGQSDDPSEELTMNEENLNSYVTTLITDILEEVKERVIKKIQVRPKAFREANAKASKTLDVVTDMLEDVKDHVIQNNIGFITQTSDFEEGIPEPFDSQSPTMSALEIAHAKIEEDSSKVEVITGELGSSKRGPSSKGSKTAIKAGGNSFSEMETDVKARAFQSPYSSPTEADEVAEVTKGHPAKWMESSKMEAISDDLVENVLDMCREMEQTGPLPLLDTEANVVLGTIQSDLSERAVSHTPSPLSTITSKVEVTHVQESVSMEEQQQGISRSSSRIPMSDLDSTWIDYSGKSGHVTENLGISAIDEEEGKSTSPVPPLLTSSKSALDVNRLLTPDGEVRNRRSSRRLARRVRNYPMVPRKKVKTHTIYRNPHLLPAETMQSPSTSSSDGDFAPTPPTSRPPSRPGYSTRKRTRTSPCPACTADIFSCCLS